MYAKKISGSKNKKLAFKKYFNQYYADAASQGFIDDEFSSLPGEGNVLDEIYEMVLTFAKVITGLLEIYHTDKKMN